MFASNVTGYIHYAAVRSDQMLGEMVVSALLVVDGIDIRGLDLLHMTCLNPTMFVCSVCLSNANVDTWLRQDKSSRDGDKRSCSEHKTCSQVTTMSKTRNLENMQSERTETDTKRTLGRAGPATSNSSHSASPDLVAERRAFLASSKNLIPPSFLPAGIS
jgi:hypothetical protein